jgi:hypothetical protein
MTATAEHITRIADFVDARINEQFTGEHNASRHWDDEPVSRALRGLRRAVSEMRAKGGLAERVSPQLALAADLAADYAWSELASIAKEWADHADYLPEFALLSHQLDAENTADAP